MTTSIITHVLKTAYETIGKRATDRDVAHERSMEGTVKAFNAIHGTNLTTSQGWSFMTLLKMKRSFTGDVFREDDFVDEAAYTALRAESRMMEVRDIQKAKQQEAELTASLAASMAENNGAFGS